MILKVLECFAVFKTHLACLALILLPRPSERAVFGRQTLCPGGPALPPAGPPETAHGTGQGRPGSITAFVATTLMLLPHVCAGTSISSDQQ